MLLFESFSNYLETLFGAVFISSLVYILGMFVAFFFLAIYIYYALAWMNIAKKMKYKNPWIAWIPIANMFLFPILAKKHWAYGFLLLIPIVNLVFIIIWFWKILELRNYRGELSLIYLGILIPYLSSFAWIALLVVFGFLAWRKERKSVKKKR